MGNSWAICTGAAPKRPVERRSIGQPNNIQIFVKFTIFSVGFEVEGEETLKKVTI